MQAQVRAAKGKPRGLSCKVSQKGAISVYGLNARFPVTLYADQWVRLLAYSKDLLIFAEQHVSELTPPKG